jgi:hypothetical protein
MKITKNQAYDLADKLGLKVHEGTGYKDGIPIEEWREGITVELEHGTKFGHITNVTKDNLLTTAKIALAHLIEFPDYYKYLSIMEKEREEYWKKYGKPNIFKSGAGVVKTLSELYGSGIGWISGGIKYKSEIQSILIPKKTFKSEKEAKKWMRKHSQFKINKIDETKKMYRFRQKSPNKYDEFRTIILDPKLEVKAVLGLKKEK